METERSPQVRIALRNCGHVDPGDINHYLAHGGYSGLSKALRMTAEEVIEEVGRSRLRERSGNGFPVAEKWRLFFDAPGSEKVLICNAAEGDPNSLTGRTLLEGDPHSVLEGMAIGAYATGAGLGWIYINAEYGLAINRLKSALKQAEDHRFLGNHLLDSNVSFRIEVKEGAGKLACSDETFLINAIEGKQTMPFVCASHPPISGLGDKPTLIHQAETWAHVSAVMEKGAEWYAGFGTEQSRGTKVLSLSGKVMHPGLIEVPMGIPLREMVYDIGGGLPDGKALKAIQVGGPTGGYLPASSLDLPMDYEHLSAAGAIMGSGSIRVIDGDGCIVDQAKCSLSFIQNESCGKCVFCREGTMQMAEILTDITEGRGKAHDIDLLLELGEGLKSGAQCDLGRTAANPVLTAIRYFREELEAHIKERECRARVCKTLEPSA
ncbi:MAG TPA: NADH-ubiquinone oxidoreductase-F iron-sulfur binding region domain-containing protein [Thermodesulfobacteriota bacterium]|nr:NADH-ubiquinone oxidoreductase-F iron-sulfur binding region domain-containing protein [Thermodesulfobacteriota bacterium]